MESPDLAPFLDSVNNRPTFADTVPMDYRAAEKTLGESILWSMD